MSYLKINVALVSLNNMALLLKAQGRLADAEPLFREALEKSPGAQLQRLQWNFGQWGSHTLLDLHRVMRFLIQELVQQYLLTSHRLRNHIRGYCDLKDFSCESGITCRVPGGTNLWHTFPCFVTAACDIFCHSCDVKDHQNCRVTRADVHLVFKALQLQSALISVWWFFDDAGSRLL